MRKTWISAALAPAIALLAGPLWAQQRAPTTDTHVVACSGAFAKDSSEDKLETTFDSNNVGFADVVADDGSKVLASVLFPKRFRHTQSKTDTRKNLTSFCLLKHPRFLQ
jgi:hypothetical protein